MGITDRIIRGILAVVFLILAFTVVNVLWLKIVLIVAAFIFILTAVVAFCPLYSPFRINTKTCCTTQSKTNTENKE